MGARPSAFKAADPEEAPPAKIPRVARNWSSQQEDIFEWFQAGITLNRESSPVVGMSQHLVVRARAGTGKTTTIIEGVNQAPESDILLCAFNKKIAEELNSRLDNPNAEAKTLHSVGFAAIRKMWRGMPVAKGTTRADFLTDKVCGMQCPRPVGRLVSQLHTKGRDMLPIEPRYKELRDLCLFFDLGPDDDWASTKRTTGKGTYDLDYVVQSAMDAMLYAAKTEPTFDIGIDFADMIYLPLVWNLLSPDYEMVVIDEAQDLTVAQITIAQRICRGRICVVGDDKQAIYAFRGADTGSLNRLKEELDAAELPLTVTYRCCQEVVRRAQHLVPDIEAAPGNPEGIVDEDTYEHMLKDAQPGEFILSRLNAPLVSTTLRLLKQGKRARMAGRDIGAGIQAILRKIGMKGSSTIEDVLKRLTAWETKTVTRLATYNQQELIERCRDQADMIRALAEDAEDSEDLTNRIEWLFTDEAEDSSLILCSSVHKAKGLEADRVWILQETLYLRGPSQEEDNIFYVATTRAKNHLTMVTGLR